MTLDHRSSCLTVLFFSLLFLFNPGSPGTFAFPVTEIGSPQGYFGFEPGADRELFDYEQMIGYFSQLDETSPRVKLVEAGKSPLGKTIYIVLVSSEENIGNLGTLKEINRRLALDPTIPDTERTTMIEEGRVFILATLSMHSGEVGPSQAAPGIAYELATTSDPKILSWLDNVVYMIVPCHNPDGMDMVVEHYLKYRGTKYEGSSMPGVYHRYVGHDNNRDFISLSQEDTRAIAAIYNTNWLPQVMVEKHQMGSRGARYFVPPPHDPISENIDEGVWNWVWIFGSNMTKDMTADGLSGVSQHYLFDDYWPGSTETCLWKNIISFLTEAASARYATPLYIEPNELGVYGKGLAEYKKSVNMAFPWPGGWWRLGDIVEYERSSSLSIIKTASMHREEILRFRNDLCRKEVEKGRTSPPYYYVLPLNQHDQSELTGLVNLLMEHGIHLYQLSGSASLDDHPFHKGDIVIPLSQPYRPFIKEVMERQVYPLRHYTPGGEVIKPYDVTSWSLPLHRGLESFEITERSDNIESHLTEIVGSFDLMTPLPEDIKALVFPVDRNESFKAAFHALKLGMKVDRLERDLAIGGEAVAAGSFIVHPDAGGDSKLSDLLAELTVGPIPLRRESDLKSNSLHMPRVALVESYFHDMDAGWTRFIFDTYHIPFTVIRPGEFEKTDFSKKFDVVVFPDQDESILKKGKSRDRENDTYHIPGYPPEFTKGIGDDGMKQLMTFTDRGGIIISWGRSTGLFMDILEIAHSKDETEEFRLPVRDISEKLKKSGLYIPGSWLRASFLEGHPLTWGIPAELGVFTRGRPVLSTSIPRFDMDRRVIATFPEKDILESGYIEHEEEIGNRTAMVWLRKGRGQFVLFGFDPQFRGSTQATYKTVFNALLLKRL